MKLFFKAWLSSEVLFYTLFSAILALSVLYLFYNSPVSYALLIAEDHIAEYGTAVSFGFAGLILLSLSYMRGSTIAKVLWLLIGLLAIAIAGEEVSWGQRIFYIETPAVLSDNNMQNEITLHNLASFNLLPLHIIATYAIILYLVSSMLILLFKPNLGVVFKDIGIPLMSQRLVPVFLLVPYFFMVYPAIFPNMFFGELGELFLGFVVLVWAIDLFYIYVEREWCKRYTPIITVLLMLVLVLVISSGLAYKSSRDSSTLREFGRTLNVMASHDYTMQGMYEQAEVIYKYIYKHPEYLNHKTGIDYAKMLRAAGKDEEAAKVLAVAVVELEAEDPLKNANSKRLRLLGVVYMLLKDDSQAAYYFSKSMEVDRKAMLSAQPNEKAKALLSISETMEIRGNIEMAITNIEQAITFAESPVLRHKLELYLIDLKKLQA